MIAVSLVGFITIFAASANASIGSAIDQQLKTDYIVTIKGSGGGPGGGGLSPVLAQKIAALPEIEASTPIRLGLAAIAASQTFLAAVDPKAVAQLFDFGARGGLDGRPRRRTAIAVSTRKAEQQAPEARRPRPGEVREDRRRPAEGRVHLQEQRARRRLPHLARELREELRRSSSTSRSSPSSSRV